MFQRRFAVALVAVVLATIVGGSSAMAADVVVFGAASLKEALDEQAKQFEAATGNKVVISYGASNALAKQIEAGAPADLFISADLDWMDYVDQKGLVIPARASTCCATRWCSSRRQPANPRSRSLPASGSPRRCGRTSSRWPIPDSVPAGKYGKSALE